MEIVVVVCVTALVVAIVSAGLTVLATFATPNKDSLRTMKWSSNVFFGALGICVNCLVILYTVKPPTQ